MTRKQDAMGRMREVEVSPPGVGLEFALERLRRASESRVAGRAANPRWEVAPEPGWTGWVRGSFFAVTLHLGGALRGMGGKSSVTPKRGASARSTFQLRHHLIASDLHLALPSFGTRAPAADSSPSSAVGRHPQVAARQTRAYSAIPTRRRPALLYFRRPTMLGSRALSHDFDLRHAFP
jgi:hypothetical protein